MERWIVLCGVAGAAYWAGWASSSPAPEPKPMVAILSPAPPAKTVASPVPVDVASSTLKFMDLDTAHTQGQWRTWIDGVPVEHFTAAARWTQTIASPFTREFVTAELLRRWSAVDVKAALSFALVCPPGERGDYVFAVVSAWHEKDSDSALEWIRRGGDGATQDRLVAEAIAQTAVQDPHRALDLALELNTWARSDFVAVYFETWGRSDPQASLAAAETLPLPGVTWAKTAVFRGWAQSDPVAAAAEASRISAAEDEDEAETVRQAITATWAVSDPQAALRYARSFDGPVRTRAVVDVLRAVVDKDPPMAAEIFSDLDPSVYSSSAEGIAEAWSYEDVDAATAWVLSLDDADTREHALAGLYSELASANPNRAETLSDSMPEWMRLETLGYIAEERASEDVDSAIAWVRSRPASERPQLFVAVASEWANRGPAEAAVFAEGIEDAEARADAIAEVGALWAYDDPEPALDWLTRIQHDDAELLESAFRAWIDEDPEAAERWYSNLDDDNARQVLSESQRSQGSNFGETLEATRAMRLLHY
ncbi:MAG: hypothetical protein AAF654_14595 [Myxococcota bacterium]